MQSTNHRFWSPNWCKRISSRKWNRYYLIQLITVYFIRFWSDFGHHKNLLHTTEVVNLKMVKFESIQPIASSVLYNYLCTWLRHSFISLFWRCSCKWGVLSKYSFFPSFLKRESIFQFNITFWQFHLRLAHIKNKKMFKSISYLSTTVLTAFFVWSISTVTDRVAALRRVDTLFLICTSNLIASTSY